VKAFSSRASFGMCASTSFGLQSRGNPLKNQPYKGGDMIAQHAAEGGVLGQSRNEPESPGRN
jgi:hypothetical protein